MLITNRPDSRRNWLDDKVVLETEGHKFEVQAVNLSTTGALVTMPAGQDPGAVAVGALVKLVSYDSRGLEKFSATGRAARVHPLDGLGTEIGIEFSVIDL